MGRPRVSVQDNQEQVFNAVIELRLLDDIAALWGLRPHRYGMPVQKEVAAYMGKSERWVRMHWPIRDARTNRDDAYVTSLVDPGMVGIREDAAHSARELEKAGLGIRRIARILFDEESEASMSATRRLLGRRQAAG